MTSPQAPTILFRRTAENPDLPLPQYQTAGAAGMDVCAAEALTLQPGETRAVAAGFAMALPTGYEAQLRPRSGLALKYGITLPNAPATIDEDYRGPVMVILTNLGRAPFVIERGHRIAQMVIARVERLAVAEVELLDETSRGSGGFGHTGV